jgi:hypothetical protein
VGSINQAGSGSQEASANVNTLASASKVLADNTSTASQKISALVTEIQDIANPAAAATNATVTEMNSVNSLATSMKTATGAILDNTGHLDLNTQKGRDSYTAIQNLITQEATYSQGLHDQGLSQQDVTTKTQAWLDQMTGPLASALGMSKDKVAGLIQQYNLTPNQISTLISQPNMAQAMSQLAAMQSQIRAANGQTITVYSNVSPAVYNAQAAVAQINGMNATIRVGSSVSVPGGVTRASALGNLFQPNADGVLDGLTPMSSSIATVVPPDTWRVVGDNMTVPELYAPLNGSQRSRDLIAAAARHEGVSTGGGQVVNNWTIAPVVTTDTPSQVAAKVAAEIGWQQMTMVGG